jgi:hypothetical protein
MTATLHTTGTAARRGAIHIPTARTLRLPKFGRRSHDGWADANERTAFAIAGPSPTSSLRPF